MEKVLLDEESKLVIVMLALLFYSRSGDSGSTIQRTKAKDDENGFLRLMLQSTSYLTDTPILQARHYFSSLGYCYSQQSFPPTHTLPVQNSPVFSKQ